MSTRVRSEAPARSGSGPAGGRRAGGRGAGGRRGPIAWLKGPLFSFHLIISVTALLSLSGLAMVLSASSVTSLDEDGSPYSMFKSQLLYTVIGAILFYLALRTPLDWVRRLSPAAVGVSLVMLMLVLVPGIGVEVQGARRWIDLGPVSLQPSEVMKLAIAVWGAHVLTRHRPMPGLLGDPLLRLGGVSVVTFVLVMLQPNLSTTIALALIVAALLWFWGLRLRWFAALAGLGVVAALGLALTSGYRARRIASFLNPGAHPENGGYQALQAKFSLADGGVFGRGPGQSRAKWNYLPNSHNDFIFAIIGEELGLIGCLLVIALFALFAYAGIRVMMRSADPFLRLLVGALTVWTVVQAFINIGYVVGLLPVTGLQLPLISAGGSSTTITLAAFGLMANAARHEPEAVAALRSGRPSRLPRRLRLPLPDPYRPERPRRRGAQRPARATGTTGRDPGRSFGRGTSAGRERGRGGGSGRPQSGAAPYRRSSARAPRGDAAPRRVPSRGVGGGRGRAE